MWNTEKRDTKQNHHLVMKKFSCIAYNRTLMRRQLYYPHIFYWVSATHVSTAFNPRCSTGSRWLCNFRRPSICQSSASPRVLRLLSLRCRFVPPKFCFGLHSAIYIYLCIDFFLPRPAHPLLQSKSKSLWVHHILCLRVEVLLSKITCLCH